MIRFVLGNDRCTGAICSPINDPSYLLADFGRKSLKEEEPAQCGFRGKFRIRQAISRIRPAGPRLTFWNIYPFAYHCFVLKKIHLNKISEDIFADKLIYNKYIFIIFIIENINNSTHQSRHLADQSTRRPGELFGRCFFCSDPDAFHWMSQFVKIAKNGNNARRQFRSCVDKQPAIGGKNIASQDSAFGQLVYRA